MIKEIYRVIISVNWRYYIRTEKIIVLWKVLDFLASFPSTVFIFLLSRFSGFGRMEIREKALWKVLEFLMGWERRSGLDSLDMVEEWDGTTHMVAKEWLWFSTQVYEI